jgi:hypothetical protein
MAFCFATVPGYEEVTFFIRTYMLPILREAVLHGTDVYKLDLTECTRENASLGENSDLLFLMGHGSPDVLTGTSLSEVVLDQENISLTQGKVVYALSCLTAERLGQQAVDAGAKAYIGFTKEYTLYMDVNRAPLQDPLSRSSIMPAMEIMRSLYLGKTVAQAVEDGKAAFQEEIRRWQVIDRPESSFIISACEWNIDCLTALGDLQATAASPQTDLFSTLQAILFK